MTFTPVESKAFLFSNVSLVWFLQRLVQNRTMDGVHPADAVEKPGTLEGDNTTA